VEITTDVRLQGVVAQYGRGVIGDVASRLTEQFAACVERKLGGA
jgi:carbon monoxide dehydrogenase subunit G